MNNIAVIGENAKNLIEPLELRGYKVIVMPRFSMLSFPVDCHPDMLFCRISSFLVTSSAYYDVAKKELDLLCSLSGCTLVLDSAPQSSPYPNEARFNALCVGNILVGNEKCISPVLLNLAKKLNLDFVHTSQGYSACSTAALSSGAITADRSIFKTLTDNGISSLKICSGNINIERYDYGFIGGASGFNENENVLYFSGDVTEHPDFDKINDFAKLRGANIVCLTDGPLYDCGGIVFF